MNRATAPIIVMGVLFLAVALHGCAAPPEPKIVTQIEKVTVPVNCNPKIGDEPQYDDGPAAIQNTTSIFDAVKLLLAGRDQRIAREGTLKAALSQCENPAPAPSQ